MPTLTLHEFFIWILNKELWNFKLFLSTKWNWNDSFHGKGGQDENSFCYLLAFDFVFYSWVAGGVSGACWAPGSASWSPNKKTDELKAEHYGLWLSHCWASQANWLENHAALLIFVVCSFLSLAIFNQIQLVCLTSNSESCPNSILSWKSEQFLAVKRSRLN